MNKYLRAASFAAAILFASLPFTVHQFVEAEEAAPTIEFSNSTAIVTAPGCGEAYTLGLYAEGMVVGYNKIDGQPRTATFDLNVSHVPHKGRVSWALGDLSGYVEVTNGDITIEGVMLEDGQAEPLVIETAKPPAARALVFSRFERHLTPVGRADNASSYQATPDIGRVNGKTVEADFVLRDANGEEHVLYDCTNDDQAICIAHEGRVSPDLKRAVFVVSRGSSSRYYPVQVDGVRTDVKEFAILESELWMADLTTRKVWQISDEKNDRTPDWCGNQCLVYASDRGKACYPLPAYNGQVYKFNCLQIHKSFLTDGYQLGDTRNLTPHEQMAWSPSTLHDGSITYTSWQGHHDHWIDKTLSNVQWGNWMNGDGTDQRVILAAHSSPVLSTSSYLDGGGSGQRATEFRGIRWLVEISKNRLTFVNYYRGNFTGSYGKIMSFIRSLAEGVSKLKNLAIRGHQGNKDLEGSGQYVPSTLKIHTRYALDADHGPNRDAQNRALGSAGYPRPHPDGAFLFTGLEGWSYRAASFASVTRAHLGGVEPNERAIYLALIDVINDPFDPKQVMRLTPRDKYHRFDADVVASYQSMFGQPEPDQVPFLDSDSKSGTLVISDLFDDTDLDEVPGKSDPLSRSKLQGNAVENYSEVVKEFAVEYIDMPTTAQKDNRWPVSERVTFKPDKNGTVVASIKCETPFRMGAIGAPDNQDTLATTYIKKNGSKSKLVNLAPSDDWVALDNMLHSVRCGETRTCAGCHAQHSEESR